MGLNVIEKIRLRSREQWQDIAATRAKGYRSWLRAHGERALILGLVAGALLIIAPKFVATLLLLTAITLFVFWNIALPESKMPPRGPVSTSSETSATGPTTFTSDGDDRDGIDPTRSGRV